MNQIYEIAEMKNKNKIVHQIYDAMEPYLLTKSMDKFGGNTVVFDLGENLPYFYIWGNTPASRE